MAIRLKTLQEVDACVTFAVGEVSAEARQLLVTADGSLLAHFEHTIAITEDSPLILSQL